MEKLTVKVASGIMGASQMFIRVGLRESRLPFGAAVQNPGGRWSYHISPGKFAEYMGMSLEQLEGRVNG